MPETTVHEILQRALALHNAGQLRLAQELYEQILRQNPDQPDALHLLGLVALQSRRTGDGIELLHRAVAARPNFPQALANLGAALVAIGRCDEAITVFAKALTFAPENPDILSNLGTAFNHQGRFDEAIASFNRAIALRASHAEAHLNLGCALNFQGRHDESIASITRALAIRPDWAQAHVAMANAHKDKGDLDAAAASCRRALELEPNYVQALNNLGSALKEQGLLDEAIAAFGRACALEPSRSMTWSNLLLTMHYQPDYDAAAILNEHRRWEEICAKPLYAQWRPHANERSPDRRLRIGYISPDFLDHAVGRFVEPLFDHHDHESFEIICYSDVLRPDAMTDRLRGHADQWHDTVALSDAELAEKIRCDRVDVLVDLALHAARNRLLAFARKAAPVQMTYLAYPGTSGLAAMDYRITDRYLDPPENDRFYSEKSIRVPSYWCYRQPVDAPPVGPAPVLAARLVTFGCLNNFAKLHPQTLSVWSEILRAVPSSRLLLHARPGSHRVRAKEVFSGMGVDAARIEFVDYRPTRHYFQTYNEIDIALDPYPFNGGTTTCDALWMGVPVVTLAGSLAVGRAGVSLLSNIGRPEWIAYSAQEYVKIAVNLAGNPAGLQSLRANLRDGMSRSSLCNEPQCTLALEGAYRQAWEAWCHASREPRSERD